MPKIVATALVNKADFERLLAVRPWARSAHFALHHVVRVETASPAGSNGTQARDLSTDLTPDSSLSVDKVPLGLQFGCIVPKRLARRAVTRNLIKRQMRSAVDRHVTALPPGHWLLRLRASFAPADFHSAASLGLAKAAREELEELMVLAQRPGKVPAKASSKMPSGPALPVAP